MLAEDEQQTEIFHSLCDDYPGDWILEMEYITRKQIYLIPFYHRITMNQWFPEQEQVLLPFIYNDWEVKLELLITYKRNRARMIDELRNNK